MDEVRSYARQRPAGHVMALTERSANHEVLWGALRECLHAGSVPEVALDELTDTEISGLEELVNFAGLWPEDLAGKSNLQRRNFVANDLERSLYRLLLEILRSRRVQEEIEALLAPLRSDDDVRRFFCDCIYC